MKAFAAASKYRGGSMPSRARVLAILMQSAGTVVALSQSCSMYGVTAMTVTNAESEWLGRVMRTISNVAMQEPWLAPADPVREGPADDVLRAAQSFIDVLQESSK
jgi:hypothetical protein